MKKIKIKFTERELKDLINFVDYSTNDFEGKTKEERKLLKKLKEALEQSKLKI